MLPLPVQITSTYWHTSVTYSSILSDGQQVLKPPSSLRMASILTLSCFGLHRGLRTNLEEVSLQDSDRLL